MMNPPLHAALPALALALAVAGCGPSQPQGNEVDPALQRAVASLPAPYNEASYEAGRRAFAQCRACHTIDEGAPNRVGPNLHAVFGREAGSAANFTYSEAVRDADFVWDADHLDHWLTNPRTFLPGNRMSFPGVRDETERRDLIAYLMVETGR